MSVSYATVTMRYATSLGVPYASEKVLFRPAVNAVSDLDDGSIITADHVEVVLNGNGEGVATLIATDSPRMAPTGWSYRVDGPDGRSFSVQLPAGTTNLADIVPVPGSDGTVVIYSGSGTSGYPNWWVGDGPPGLVIGSVIGDMYVDSTTDTIYQLK